MKTKIPNPHADREWDSVMLWLAQHQFLRAANITNCGAYVTSRLLVPQQTCRVFIPFRRVNDGRVKIAFGNGAMNRNGCSGSVQAFADDCHQLLHAASVRRPAATAQRHSTSAINTK